MALLSPMLQHIPAYMFSMWLTDLLQDDVGVDHQVLLRIRRQLDSVDIGVRIKWRAAGDVVAQIVLPNDLRMRTSCSDPLPWLQSSLHSAAHNRTHLLDLASSRLLDEGLALQHDQDWTPTT